MLCFVFLHFYVRIQTCCSQKQTKKRVLFFSEKQRQELHQLLSTTACHTLRPGLHLCRVWCREKGLDEKRLRSLLVGRCGVYRQLFFHSNCLETSLPLFGEYHRSTVVRSCTHNMASSCTVLPCIYFSLKAKYDGACSVLGKSMFHNNVLQKMLSSHF